MEVQVFSFCDCILYVTKTDAGDHCLSSGNFIIEKL